MIAERTRHSLIQQDENGPQGDLEIKSFTMVVEHTKTALAAILAIRRIHKQVPIYVVCSKDFRLNVSIRGIQRVHYIHMERLGEDFTHIKNACERYDNTMYIPKDALTLGSLEDVGGYDVIAMPNYKEHKSFEDLMYDDTASFLSDYLFVGSVEIARIFETGYEMQENFDSVLTTLPGDVRVGFFPPEHMYDSSRPGEIDIHPKSVRLENDNTAYTEKVKEYVHNEYPGVAAQMETLDGFEDATFPMTQENARPFPDLIALGSPAARTAVWESAKELPHMYPTEKLETNYLVANRGGNMIKAIKGHREYKHRFTHTKELHEEYAADDKTVQVDCSSSFGMPAMMMAAPVVCMANPDLVVVSIVSDPIEKAIGTYLGMRPQGALRNLMQRPQARNRILANAQQAAQIRPYIRLLGEEKVLVWDRDLYNKDPGLHMHQLQKFVGIKDAVKEGRPIEQLPIEEKEYLRILKLNKVDEPPAGVNYLEYCTEKFLTEKMRNTWLVELVRDVEELTFFYPQLKMPWMDKYMEVL